MVPDHQAAAVKRVEEGCWDEEEGGETKNSFMLTNYPDQ